MTGLRFFDGGFLVAATITDGGYGYTTPPIVRIVGGGGSGAVATATVSNGVVTGITILNAGSGYTNTPVVAIAPPFPLTLGLASRNRSYVYKSESRHELPTSNLAVSNVGKSRLVVCGGCWKLCAIL
jgi:hypothetical protein